MGTTEYTVVYEPENPRYIVQGREKVSSSGGFENIERFHILENAIRSCDEYVWMNPDYDYRVIEVG